MSPLQLKRLLTDLESAAEVVDAIDDRGLQAERGWDLARWRYDLVPWGVRFYYQDPGLGGRGEVTTLVTLAGVPRGGRTDASATAD